MDAPPPGRLRCVVARSVVARPAVARPRSAVARSILFCLALALAVAPAPAGEPGVTWERLAPRGATELDNIGFAFDPEDGDAVYMATRGDRPKTGDSPWAGVWKSADAGATWRKLSGEAGKTTNGDSSILFSPHDPATIYAASEYEPRLMVSRDRGETWTKIPQQIKHAIAIAVHPTDPDRLWVGADDSIHSTRDGGKTWTHDVDTGLPRYGGGGPSSTAGYLFTNPEAPDTLYAGYYCANDPAQQAGVYKTTDGGATWRAANGGIVCTPTPVQVNFLRTEGLLSMAQAPSAPRTLYAGTVWSDLYRSDDGAESWTRVHRGGMKTGIPWTATDPATGRSKTFDTSYRALGVSPADPMTVAAGTGLASAVLSRDGGVTWTDLGCVLPSRLDGDAVVVDVPGAGERRGAKPLDVLGGGKGWATQVTFHPDDPDVLYVATYWGIYRGRLPAAERTPAPD